MDKPQTSLPPDETIAGSSGWFSRALGSTHFLWIFLLVVFFTHIPTGKSVFQTDDFTQWAALTTPPLLAEKGLPIADPDNGFFTRISNAFMFLSSETGQTAALKNYGAIPWWVADDASMHMFRPLTAMTHWLDYQYLNEDVFWMQLHSVFYLLVLAASYYYFCRWLGARSWVAALALLLFVFSYSIPQNLSWLAARNALIAPIFAIWAVLFHHLWRSRGQYWFLPLSLLALLLALLAAEAGIATLAYLGAYMLLLDKQPFWLRVWTLLPALVVVVLWRIGYSWQGFGANNVALYVDPVRSPLEFLSERLLWLPMYYARVLLGPLAFVFVKLTSSVLWLSLISMVVCGLILGFFFKPLRQNPLMQFALLGSWVAIIPFLASSPSARTEPFLHLGFMLILAGWLNTITAQRPLKWSLKILVGFVLTLHLLVPGLATIARHWRLVTLEAVSVDAYTSVADELAKQPADLVIVNPPDYFAYYHRPLSWLQKKQVLPERIHILAPGLTAMSIERLDKRQYRLRSEEGFALTGITPLRLDQRADPQANRKRVLHYRANNQIMLPKERQFSASDQYGHAGMQVKLSKFQHNQALVGRKQKYALPTEIIIEFSDNQAKVWQWYDWREHRYKKFTHLAIGEQRLLSGPFSEQQ